MFKKIVNLLLILGLVGTSVGCGQQVNSNKEVNNEVAIEQDQTVKFTLWHSFVGEDQRADFMAKRMEQFRELHPEYIIDEQKIPRDQYQTKLKTEAAAGQLPDAFLIWPNAMTKEFVDSSLIKDISSYLEENPEWKNSFTSKALDEFTFNGKTYSAGLGISITSILFYNKALFDQYGLKAPETYEELKEVIGVFNEKGIIPIALGNKAKWPVQSTIFSNLANRQTGSEWLESVLGRSGSKFTDQEFIEALHKMKELVDIGAFNKDYNSIDEVQMRSYFYKGEAAMMIGGSWILPEMIKNAPDDIKENVELTILPKLEDGKGDPSTMSGVSSTGIAISAKVTPEQEAAIKKLIQFLTDDDAQKMYAASNIPVSSVTVNISEMDLDPAYKKMVSLIQKYPMVTVYDSALNSELTDIVNNGLQAVMLGAVQPEQLANDLQKALE
ncbi:extracellular solute-binding protein [Cellulosilyticum sp. I15G10I2]|uniref:extracellular solute-binding protein n=1 Tax=Cellulosilyticum sp. I15G10I2 TaxID=1892843 RepID=UPI00085C5AB1|nr:extracellular solute-binding protein [Cellulosilyticum sp. I15G10I2]